MSSTTAPAIASSATMISERRDDQPRSLATSSAIGMDSSLARATTADEDVIVGEGGAKPANVLPHRGSGGGGLDKRSVLTGALSIGSSTASGVPTEVSVFRRWEAGTISPVP